MLVSTTLRRCSVSRVSVPSSSISRVRVGYSQATVGGEDRRKLSFDPIHCQALSPIGNPDHTPTPRCPRAAQWQASQNVWNGSPTPVTRPSYRACSPSESRCPTGQASRSDLRHEQEVEGAYSSGPLHADSVEKRRLLFRQEQAGEMNSSRALLSDTPQGWDSSLQAPKKPRFTLHKHLQVHQVRLARRTTAYRLRQRPPKSRSPTHGWYD